MIRTSTVKLGDKLIRHSGRLESVIRRDPSRWREAFEDVVMLGETRVSWFIGPSGSKIDAYNVSKVKKKEMATAPGYYLDWETIERERWVNLNYYELGDAVRRIRDYDTLVKVAELIGYKSK